MSNNVTTAAQWGQVIDNLDSIKKSVLTQATGVSNELKTQTALLQALTEQKRVASEAGNTSLIALIQNNIDATNRDIRGNNQVLSNIARDIAQIDSDLNNAFQQKSIADAGPPTDNSTTPPETVVPGQTNTTVTIETPPPIDNVNNRVVEVIVPAPVDATPAPEPAPLITAPVALPETPATEYPPLPVTPGPLPDWYVNPNATGPDTPVVAPEVIQNATPASVDPNVNVGFGTDPTPSVITPGTGTDPITNVNLQVAPQGISTALNDTRSQATKEDATSSQQKKDWRAKLSLAPKANYLYKVPPEQAGILKPLQATDGVIFPYTPAISVTYTAGYDASDLVHSNYKVYQYKGSSVDLVSITADFTAQDTTEATYLLAVIHFFRSVTKMFYGQDQNPYYGVPPPLCYLTGFGAYTYDAHPLVVTNFTYATPTDVDYIRAGSQTNQPGVNIAQQNPTVNTFNPSVSRVATNGLKPAPPNFQTQNSMINSEATYVPTKLQLQITCIPIVTRNDISNTFSLKEYATGKLLRGSKRSGGGIW